MKNILYLTYDGLTDNLGQSQILPYLSKISSLGYNVKIVSFEKTENFERNQQKVNDICAEHKIFWNPKKYTKWPPLISTIIDLFTLWFTAQKIIRKDNIDVIHCRSYITALIGLRLKKKKKIPFIFDMRGFWADERMEGNIWSENNFIHRYIYKYFKNKEVDFLRFSDHIISLTEACKGEILGWKQNIDPAKISVIPCSVDTTLFKREEEKHTQNEHFELVYLGSLGTWYMLEEMIDFFVCLKRTYPGAKFRFITKDNNKSIRRIWTGKGLQPVDLIIKGEIREALPKVLQRANLSIFFIKPTFSKKASSPTKLGEIISMGIPIICNSGVGDIDGLMNANQIGCLVEKFDTSSYQEAVVKFKTMDSNENKIRNVALNNFSLDEAIKSYVKVYNMV